MNVANKEINKLFDIIGDTLVIILHLYVTYTWKQSYTTCDYRETRAINS